MNILMRLVFLNSKKKFLLPGTNLNCTVFGAYRSVNRRATYSSTANMANLSLGEDVVSVDAPIKFEDVQNIDRGILNSIKDHFKFTSMTPVQEQVLPLLLNEKTKNKNVLVQAKTGTGKTVAFMIPVLQNVMHRFEVHGRSNKRPIALVVAPTREIAFQIRDESSKLAKSILLRIRPATKVVVGGTNKNLETKKVIQSGCDVLVATPGRLLDHLNTDPEIVSNVSILVYDEADRLLDQGFAREMEKLRIILSKVTDVQQILMFSATVRPDVVTTAKSQMGSDFQLIRTSQADEAPTHLVVPQTVVLVNKLSDHIEPLLSMLRSNCEKSATVPFKAIVFMRTIYEVHYFTKLFKNMLLQYFDIPVIEISSKLTQNARTKNLNIFKSCQSGILIASDVVARGVDVKNVTHVFQVGACSDTETYIHRVGRTGRAGQTGEAITILSNVESPFYTQLRAMNINFAEQYKYKSDPVLCQEIYQSVKDSNVLAKSPPTAMNVMRQGDKRSEKRREDADESPATAAQRTIVSQIGYYRSILESKHVPIKEILEELTSARYLYGMLPGDKFILNSRTSKIMKTQFKLDPKTISVYFEEEPAKSTRRFN
ncbi:P-loop containing nucleoside triphosphate hydrolase protein [Lipomyces arxii]|uniref:P-loop containing nucleoside triphosphate hydrolase protein n=1 Tax=Lipomyces arxii TaxID=56418 RepID=UPI0034CEB730